jgi:hypothetical protein
VKWRTSRTGLIAGETDGNGLLGALGGTV